MKIALVHDHLTCKAGGEQVALAFHKAFPNSPIYTLAYNADATFPEFRACDIRPSWFQRITSNEQKLKRLFFPLGLLAMRSLSLKEYDVVLISGTHCGKYVRFSPKTKVISYTFTPFRLAWDPESYAEYNNSSGIKRIILDIVVKILRKTDFFFAKRVNFFLAMTSETRQRIVSAYSPLNEVSIINPPVNNISKFSFDEEGVKDYYLVVSRLEYYKKVDLVVDLFNKLKKNLVIVGRGSLENELRALNISENTTFRKDLSTEELVGLYENCKAFIFPQHEDYGLTALEANAAGRPVIAFSEGGIRDTQISLSEDSINTGCTAVFFNEQNESSLEAAILKFESNYERFDPSFIRTHAEGFSEDVFIEKIRSFVKEVAE
jgi:glycosyltransferase involved in cell wall biosynthesis